MVVLTILTDVSRDCSTRRNQRSQTLCRHNLIVDGIRIVRFGGMVEHVTLDKRCVSKNRSQVKVNK